MHKGSLTVLFLFYAIFMQKNRQEQVNNDTAYNIHMDSHLIAYCNQNICLVENM